MDAIKLVVTLRSADWSYSHCCVSDEEAESLIRRYWMTPQTWAPSDYTIEVEAAKETQVLGATIAFNCPADRIK